MSLLSASVHVGAIGVFANRATITPERASAIEALGYRTLWLGGSPDPDLHEVEIVLEATATIVVATAIVDVWAADAAVAATAYHRVEQRYPGRLLLGIGASHPEIHRQYVNPYQVVAAYPTAWTDSKCPPIDGCLPLWARACSGWRPSAAQVRTRIALLLNSPAVHVKYLGLYRFSPLNTK